MKKLYVLPLCLALAAAPAFAGDAGPSKMDPEVIATETSSGPGVDFALFVLLDLLIMAAIQ